MEASYPEGREERRGRRTIEKEGRKEVSEEGKEKKLKSFKGKEKEGTFYKDISIDNTPSISPKKLCDKLTNSDSKCLESIRYTVSGRQNQVILNK